MRDLGSCSIVDFIRGSPLSCYASTVRCWTLSILFVIFVMLWEVFGPMFNMGFIVIEVKAAILAFYGRSYI